MSTTKSPIRDTYSRTTEGHMGAGNVSAVYVRWAFLPDRPFRLLSYMALVSMDTDVPPRYFGGYPALARALGRNTSDGFDKRSATAAEKRARKADMEAVRNGLVPLLECGVAVVDRPEAPGRGPEFALYLDGRSRPGLPDGPGETCRRSRDRLPTVQAAPADLGGVGGETLTEEERGDRGIPRGNNSSKVSSSLANPAISEMTYEIAAGILGKLPDLGLEYRDQINNIEGMRDRVIAAATLAIAENPLLAPKEAS